MSPSAAREEAAFRAKGHNSGDNDEVISMGDGFSSAGWMASCGQRGRTALDWAAAKGQHHLLERLRAQAVRT